LTFFPVVTVYCLVKNLGVLLVEPCVPDDDQAYARILASLRIKESTVKKPTKYFRILYVWWPTPNLRCPCSV